ncbi:MAG: response regulator [Oligoflexales bacterium]|nr:response regulator [Oligoflexales bacterium]
MTDTQTNNRRYNKILVIDDSRSVRSQMKELASSSGYEILEAANGNEGLEILRNNDDIALVFCDVNMPELDGISMLYKISSEKALGEGKQHPPIIIITTESGIQMAQTAKNSGAKGWIIKPVSQETFDVMVKKVART